MKHKINPFSTPVDTQNKISLVICGKVIKPYDRIRNEDKLSNAKIKRSIKEGRKKNLSLSYSLTQKKLQSNLDKHQELKFSLTNKKSFKTSQTLPNDNSKNYSNLSTDSKENFSPTFEPVRLYTPLIKKKKTKNVNNAELSSFKSTVPRFDYFWKLNGDKVTSGKQIGPGSFYNEHFFVKDGSKKSFFFLKKSNSSILTQINPIERELQEKATQTIEHRVRKKIRRKILMRQPLFIKQDERRQNDYYIPVITKKRSFSYQPEKEIVSIFKSKSLKCVFDFNKHVPGPAYYTPKLVSSKKFFKNKHNIWV